MLTGFAFFFILLFMALDNAFGVFLAPSGQQHTNPSPTHNWNNLCVWGTKGSIESPSTRAGRNGQSATPAGEMFSYVPLILTHTKPKRTFLLLLATMLHAVKAEKKIITDFFPLKKE